MMKMQECRWNEGPY